MKNIHNSALGITSLPLLSLLSACLDNSDNIDGTLMPDINLKTTQGENINPAYLRRPVIMHFYGLWDKISEKDRHNWFEVIRKLKKYDEIKIIEVHCGLVPEKYGNINRVYNMRSAELRVPLIYDPNATLASMISLPTYPSTLIINSKGEIIDHFWNFKYPYTANSFVDKVKDDFNIK